jgi:hypothetical protein
MSCALVFFVVFLMLWMAHEGDMNEKQRELEKKERELQELKQESAVCAIRDLEARGLAQDEIQLCFRCFMPNLKQAFFCTSCGCKIRMQATLD